MKRITMLSLGVLLLGPAFATLHAEHRGKMIVPMQEHRLENLTQTLQLSADQQTKVKLVLDEETAGLKPVMEQMRALRQKSESGIEAVLTPEQKQKYHDMKEKQKDMRHERRDEFRKSHAMEGAPATK